MPGKQDSIVKTVYVEQPVADFAMDGIVYKTSIGFNDLTTGGIVTTWFWNFGDPQSGKLNIDYSPAPRHIFDSAGTYNIMLVVSTSGGCIDTIIKTIQILSEQTPVADFSAPTFNPYIQASLKLVDQSLYKPTSWKWTFSPNYVTFLNGSSDTSENPEISFDSLGTYDVYLDATNSAGTGSINKQFVVKNYTAPVANFVGDPDTVLVGQTVNFTDLSSNDPTSWAWNFGDTASGNSNTSALQFPTHQYASKGNYSVSLTATNPAGSNTASKSKYIVVNNDFKMCDNSASSTNGMSGNIYDSGGPTGNYNDGSNCGFLIKPYCSGKIVLNFTSFNMLTGDVLQVFEGVDETGKPLHPGNGFSGSSLPGTLISTAGAIFLKEITDANSNSTGFAASWTAFANSKPNARVLADTIAYINSPFTFKNGTTQGLANTYSWDLDLDGVYDAYGPQATTTFASTGKQTVRLKVENCAGIDSVTFTVNVKTPTQVPVANFSVDRDTVLPVDMVTFTDKSTNGPTSWLWDIQPAGNFFFYSGDEYSQNPQVGFITSGNYTVCLTATNAVGSSQIFCKQNVVIVKEKAQLCLFPYTSDVAAGVMYDSGDLNGDYSNNENCGYVIQPCADVITLHFNSFNYAAGDYLTIYDGIDNTGIPLFNGSGYTGTTLPPDLAAYSGAMYVETNSGPSGTAPGFDAEWNSTPATYPVAGFTAPSLAYTQGSITDFKNTSVGTRNAWAWDFDGDGITDATTKDASWSYVNPGNYKVTLTATNCLGTDVFTFNITVQDPTAAPVAGFKASMSNPSLTDVVSFADTSSNGPNTWNWTFTPNTVNFINGTSNISKNPQVTFADTGWYDVCLAVSNNLGSDQTCHNQSIYAINYCTPNPTAAANVGISKVQLGSINKNSVMVGGYQDFTSTDQTQLERRSTATIYMEKSSVGLNQSWKVWIDFNQNGSFADAEDQVVSIASTSNAQESASFQIPRDALKGFTRMRVGVSAGNNSNGPCNNSFGEYEDYRIEIIDDITKPIITLNGSNPDTVELGYNYYNPGAIAMDNCDGNISANLVVVSNVNTSATGIYQITYDVTDSSGNKADQVTRLVWVSPDATAPVITLYAGSTLTWPVNTAFVDPGFTATDNIDGNVTTNVQVTGSVDVNHPADFTITYTVTDAAGNSGTATRLVQVRDTIAPVITLNGNSTMVMTVGMPFTDPGSHCYR
jgi:PKD repeat protein